MRDYELVAGWIIRETQFNAERESSRATVFALANGYMGLRGVGEEIAASLSGLKGCYINGIYDTPSGKLTEREFPNVQDWTRIAFCLDGETFDLGHGEVMDYGRELDMKRGAIRRLVRWRSPTGKAVTVESERFLSLARIHLGVIRWKLTTEHGCEIELRSGIDADVNNRWAQHFRQWYADQFPAKAQGDHRSAPQKRHGKHEELEDQCNAGDVWLQTRTFQPGYQIGVMARHLVTGQVGESWFEHVEKKVDCVWRFELTAGESVTLTKFAAVYESRFSQGKLQELCRQELESAEGAGYDRLKHENTERWAQLWEGSDVEIEGDEEAQMGTRFAVFHLLAAAPHHCDRISVPARGLQGQDYYGSIFWDFEIFVAPFLSYTQPSAARNALMYRYHTLEGARRKARNLGYEGAYFAWQSQETGDEQCDVYVFADPRSGEKIRSYFADEQIHISGDIVYAGWQYFEATGDRGFWEEGWEQVVVEVADFFWSRSTYSGVLERTEIRGVLGPDEYHEHVDNNAYTNRLAEFSLQLPAIVSKILREDILRPVKRIVETHTPKPSRQEGWGEFRKYNLRPQIRHDQKLIPQFDGYFELKDEPLNETRRRLAHPDLYPGGPLGPFQETQNIKQADVILMLFLFRDEFDAETKAANWDYYEPRTAHDSSLSPMAYALVAADIGRVEWAYKYFLLSVLVDLGDFGPHWNLGIHAASLGGAWQCLVFGFCRLKLDLEGIKITSWPQLPSRWERVRFRFSWHGNRMEYETDGKSVTIRSLSENAVPVIFPEARPVQLKPGGSLRRAFGQ